MNKFLLPRGIRNNNPGNIRLNGTRWQGIKPEQQDKSFVEFESELYGLRALMRLLLTYHFKYGLDTVESIINRYAPPHENATDHYIHHISKKLGVKRHEKIMLGDKDILIKLATAIVLHENGRPKDKDAWYDSALYQEAADLAFGA